MYKDIELIDLVKSYNFLYNKKHKFFKDNKIKEKAWQNIAEKLNKPVNEVIKRWAALRKRFIEHRKKLANIPPGVPTANYVEPWHLYPAVQFLNEHISMRVTSFNMKDCSSPCPEIESNSSELSQSSQFEVKEEVLDEYKGEILLPYTISRDQEPSTNTLTAVTSTPRNVTGSKKRKNGSNITTNLEPNISPFGSYFNQALPVHEQDKETASMLFAKSLGMQLDLVRSNAKRLQLQSKIYKLLAEALEEEEGIY